jgi:transcriptional regulator with PAS, ATPase and Fis domain
VELVKKLPRRRKPKPRLAIDALGAVVAAGRSAPTPELEQRVVQQLARMLAARVLFHRIDGAYVRREAQAVHTLSSWTMHRLESERQLRARRIRPRPEFWRPEQRRPRGVLTFPIGSGTACLARSRPFRSKEVQAVGTVLGILRARRPGDPAEQVTSPTARPPAAGSRTAFKGLVGSSKPWRKVLDHVWKVAPSRCSIVLRGESGTGKELLARAIHLASNRGRGPFVPVNCAAVHPETLHSELFGHIRGAFTGATRNRTGLVRSAHRGTLFLDEVGDMPASMQVALLRTLQDGFVRPVGSTRDSKVNVRVVCATNRDLEALVERGRFRADLYHRLNVVDIRLPPLRERIDDLAELSRYLLGRLDRPRGIDLEAVAVLAGHDWPGNVRELENVLLAAALLSDDPVLRAGIVDDALRTRRRRTRRPTPAPERLAPRSAAILRLLARDWQSSPALARELGVSTRTVNRELRRLLARGYVRSAGEARARRYRATTSRDSS